MILLGSYGVLPSAAPDRRGVAIDNLFKRFDWDPTFGLKRSSTYDDQFGPTGSFGLYKRVPKIYQNPKPDSGKI